MPAIHASVRTGNASRYLQQLCKHWSHRFAVEFDPKHGVIHLTGADCTLDADTDVLLIELRATDPEVLGRMSGVVADHLKRFAFREELAIEWSAVPES